MSLFKTLITKPLRWVASVAKGKVGRDFVDRYAPLLEEAATYWAPELGLDSREALSGLIEDWAITKGVPAADSKRFATEALKRAEGIKA